jgi:pSer/pThr/pTyr-binding forkhead associated (FHA) protein
MAKLVIQNQGMTGRAHELNVDRTTIGRVEDNTFQIADQSVSSHHCEIHLQGAEILIRDLNSTNGTFINNEKISEAILKPGQTLRLGQVELKLEAEGGSAISSATLARKPVDATMIMPRGVSLGDLEKGGGRPPGFDTNTAFSKKSNKVNKYFIIGGIIVALIIAGFLWYAFTQASHK